MPKNVNISILDFNPTGATVNFPQYEIDITIDWTTLAGVDKAHTEIVNFPNILAHPSISNEWLKDRLTSLMLAALREILGIDAE